MPTPRQYASDADRQRAYRDRQRLTLQTLLDAKNLPASVAIPTIPSLPRWKALREKVRADLQAIVDEMQAYQGDRSEEWQDSEKGEAFQEKLDAANAALEALDSFTLD